MARQNSTITVQGKLGNIVGYKGRDGKRLARIRQTEVKNPKTDGQIIQRMILATASKAYGRMKSIVDHSWQGVSYGGISQSYFLKRAIEDIRTFVSANLPNATETNLLNFRGLAEPKNYAMSGVGLLVSEGTLPTINTILTTGESPEFDHFGGMVNLENATVSDVLGALGGVVGDQLTIIAIASNGQFYTSRYVVNAEATGTQLNEPWDGTADGDAFDNKSSVGILNIQVSNGKIVPSIGGGLSVIAATIILSRKEGNNWLRSTQRLVPIGDNINTLLVENGPNVVLPLWKAGTAVINTENPYYLNNADL